MQGPVVEGLETINYYETDSDNDSMESEEEVETDDEDDEDRRMEKAWDQEATISHKDAAIVGKLLSTSSDKGTAILGKVLLMQGSHGSHGSHGNLMNKKQGSHGSRSRICSNCGVFEVFKDITAECCFRTTGQECVFPDDNWFNGLIPLNEQKDKADRALKAMDGYPEETDIDLDETDEAAEEAAAAAAKMTPRRARSRRGGAAAKAAAAAKMTPRRARSRTPPPNTPLPSQTSALIEAPWRNQAASDDDTEPIDMLELLQASHSDWVQMKNKMKELFKFASTVEGHLKVFISRQADDTP